MCMMHLTPLNFVVCCNYNQCHVTRKEGRKEMKNSTLNTSQGKSSAAASGTEAIKYNEITSNDGDNWMSKIVHQVATQRTLKPGRDAGVGWKFTWVFPKQCFKEKAERSEQSSRHFLAGNFRSCTACGGNLWAWAENLGRQSADGKQDLQSRFRFSLISVDLRLNDANGILMSLESGN